MNKSPHSDALENVSTVPADDDAGAGGEVDDAALAAAAGPTGAGPTGAGPTGEAEGETGGATGAPEPRKAEEPTMGEVMASVADLATQVKAMAINAQAGPTQREEKQEEAKIEPFDFSNVVTDELFEEITRDRGKFVDILNKVAAAAANKAVEHSARTVPVIVATEVDRTTTAVDDVKAFYTKNKDLLNFRPTVRLVFDSIVAANPGMPSAEIFEGRLANAVREKLGLKTPVAGRKGGKPKTNVAPGTGGRQPDKGRPAPTKAFEDTLKKMGG